VLPILPLLEPLDPLMPPELLERGVDPDPLWSFLFRLFAIRPPAHLGALISQLYLCEALPSL
jgi:hypothetical protein